MILAELDAAGHEASLLARLFVVLAILAGFIKCVSISSRPQTNTKCARSLALFFAALLVAALLGLIPRDQPSQPAVAALLGLAMLGGLIASVVLAILGLNEYSRERGRFTQGRAQAIWALSLSGIFLIWGIYSGATNASRQMRMRSHSARNELLTFKDLNFQFRTPGWPWVQVDTGKLAGAAKLTFYRAYPEMSFAVIAEPLMQSDYASENLADFGRVRLQSVAATSQVLQRQPASVGALNGLEVQSRAEVQNQDLFYVQWFCVTNGWGYQLMAWGKFSNAKKITADIGEMRNGFALLDYHRRPVISGGQTVTDWVSTNFGCRFHTDEADWLEWNGVETACPFGTFGVLHRKDAALAVCAVSLASLKAEPEAIYRGLGGLLTAKDVLKDAHEIHQDNLDGMETAFTQSLASGKEYGYRLRILRGGGFAYLIAAWVEEQNAGKDAILDEAMSSVKITVPAAPPNPAAMSEQEKRAERMGLNSIGMIYFGEDRYQRSAEFFKQAVDLDGAIKKTPYLANFTLAQIRGGNFQPALDELEKHQELVDSEPSLAAQRAFLQGQSGQVDLAITNFARLFAGGYNSTEYFKQYILLLAQTKQQQRGLEEVESYLKTTDSADIRLVQAALLKGLKRFDEAVTQLQAQHKKNSFDSAIAYSLGDALIDAGRPNEALAVSAEMFDDEGESVSAWLLKGRAQFALKWYREARESFNKVIAGSPSNTEARQFLQALSGILGEGSNLASQEPIEAVPVPSDLTNAMPQPPEKFGETEGAYYTRRLTAVSFKQGKELKITDYLKAHIVSSSGVSKFSTFQFPFKPLAEEYYINQLLVKDGSGALVSTGRVVDCYILDDSSSLAPGSTKILNIPVAGLQPGFNVELALTRRDLGTAKEFAFFPETFSGRVPTQEQDLYYTGDTNLIRFASSPAFAPVIQSQGLLWRKTNPPVIPWEPMQPELADYIPAVWLSDGSASWPDLVANYLAQISDRLELPLEQKQLARQLAANGTNLTQKIAAIADHVQTNYTYKAIEFGRRARLPQTMADLVRNKYGDCKDHAVLLQQMLQAAGIPANLALVNATSPTRKDLPSLDQFNHMIVYIPSANQFVDCTAKGFDLFAGNIGLAGRDALILDPDKTRFLALPAYPTNGSLIAISRSVELTNQTDAFVRESIKFTGLYAGIYRNYFHGLPVESRRLLVANQFVGSAGELKDFSLEGMDDAHSPLVIKIDYVARRQFQIFDKEMAGNPPVDFERSCLLGQTIEKRTTPFEIPIPLTIEGAVDIHVPANFVPEPAESLQNLDSPFISCLFSVVTNETGWHQDFYISKPAGRFAADQYSAHNLAMEQAVNTLGLDLKCQKPVN